MYPEKKMTVQNLKDVIVMVTTIYCHRIEFT